MKYTNYKLRGWMGANRVSGTEMADRIGLPYGTFRLKIEGKTEWKLSEVISIMQTTGCALEEIFEII